MEIINVKGRTKPLPEDLAIALGTFDGVHRGHIKIIDAVVKKAHGKKTAVYTFSNRKNSFPHWNKKRSLSASWGSTIFCMRSLMRPLPVKPQRNLRIFW